jgi:predicted branched-subunit amino acid permease
VAVAGERFKEGVRAVAPLLLGTIPFGLIVGVTIAGTEIDNLAGWATSVIIFAGAAQLALIELVDAGAIAIILIATPIVINLRMAMYSAALATHFRKLSPFDQLWLPYLLTDQTFVMSMAHFRPDEDPVTIKWYYVGVGTTLWTTWLLATTVGVVVGAEVPPGWSLDFTIALVFLALLARAIAARPALLAAAVGGAVAVLSLDMPNGTGIMVATVAGVAAGSISDWRLNG